MLRKEKSNARATGKDSISCDVRNSRIIRGTLAGPWRRARRTERHGRECERSAVRDRVLLQGEMGACRGIPGALQEKSLSGVEKGDGAGPHAEGEYGDAAVPHDGRQPLGLSRDHRFQE